MTFYNLSISSPWSRKSLGDIYLKDYKLMLFQMKVSKKKKAEICIPFTGLRQNNINVLNI